MAEVLMYSTTPVCKHQVQVYEVSARTKREKQKKKKGTKAPIVPMYL
jgi:hypothetical protein